MKNSVIPFQTRLRLLVFCVSLLFVICAGLVGTSVSVKAGLVVQNPPQTPRPTPAPTAAQPAPQTAPAEKTVEQVQTSIKVLTGMPASQLGMAMNYIDA